MAKDIRSLNLKKHVMTEEERLGAWPIFAEDIVKTQELIGMDLSSLVPEGAALPKQHQYAGA